MADDPFTICEQAVRVHDPDRFFAALFAPEAVRPHLFAITAFHYELAHAVQATHEPMLRDIRLMWWRETLQTARAGTPRPHAVAQALAGTLAAHDLPDAVFEPVFAARAAGRETLPAGDFADATAGTLMRAWLRVMATECDVCDAAIAYGLAGMPGEDAALARAHYAKAWACPMPKAALPAVLPAALVPLYLKRSDPPLWRKQIVYLRTALRGRL